MELSRTRRRKRSLPATAHNSLMLACQQESKEDVCKILDRQPGVAAQRDPTGKNALHYCAENTNVDCASSILSANPSLLNAPDDEGYTPLHLAVISGNKSMVKYLLTRGANPSAVDREKHSSVHWATVSGNCECLDILISSGADPSTPDIHGAYPVHYAAQMCGPNSEMGNDVKVGLAVLTTLLSKKINVSCTDSDGRPPLLWAASGGSSDAILALVKAGADVNAADREGLTALHCAASRGHVDCLETLISFCGAEVDKIDEGGCSALFYATAIGHADCTNLLLSFGSQPDRQDKKGRTPAHCGAAKGQLETLKILAHHKANLWLRNAKGDMPLHEAVQSGRKDLVEWLLQRHHNSVNVSNANGRTPLHIAAITNNVDMCKVLMDYGAFVNPVMRNSKGLLLTPMDAALHRGNRNCAKYLSLHGALPASKLTEKRDRPAEIHHPPPILELSPATQRRLRDSSAQTEPRSRDADVQARVDSKTVSACTTDLQQQPEMRKERVPLRCSAQDGKGKPIIAKVYVHTKRSRTKRLSRKPTAYRRDLQGERLLSRQRQSLGNIISSDSRASNAVVDMETAHPAHEITDTSHRKASQSSLYEESQSRLFEEQESSLFEQPQSTLYEESQSRLYEEPESTLFEEPQSRLHEEPQSPLPEEHQPTSYEGSQSEFYDEQQRSILEAELPDVPPESVQEVPEEQSDTLSPERENESQACGCYDNHDGTKCNCSCHQTLNRTEQSIENRRRSYFKTQYEPENRRHSSFINQYEAENQSPLSSIRSLESTIKDSGFSDDVDRGHRRMSSSDEENDFSDSEISRVKRKKRHVARYIVSSGAAETFRLHEDDEEDEKAIAKPRSSSLPHLKKKEDRLETFPRLLNRPTITKEVQKSLKKYQMERRLFYELQELKRKQITTLPLEEREAVVKMVDRFRNYVLGPTMTDFTGPYTFSAFEKYLYEQLRKLSMGGRIPKPKNAAKDRVYTTTIPQIESRDPPVLCTCTTHKCHHKLRKKNSNINLNQTENSDIPLLPDIPQTGQIPRTQQSRTLANRSKSWDRLEESPRRNSTLAAKFSNLQLSNSLPSLSNPFPRRVPAALLAAISEKLGPDVHPEDTVVVEMSSNDIHSKMRHAFTVQELKEVVTKYEQQAGRKVKPIPLETVIDPEDDGPITFEIRHGKEKNVFRLPAGKLKDNKKWFLHYCLWPVGRYMLHSEEEYSLMLDDISWQEVQLSPRTVLMLPPNFWT